MHFDLGEVLSRAWQITWKHKVLWVFNMFPILISFLFIPFVFIPIFFVGPNALVNQTTVNELTYRNLFIASSIFLGILSIILYASGASSASLGILRIARGQTQLSFQRLFEDGLHYFWRILGVAFLLGAGIAVMYLVFLGCTMLFGMATMGIGMVCLQPLYLLVYPATLLVYSLIEQAEAAVIADNLGVIEAVSRGWLLLRTNFWSFVLISIIIYFSIFILGLIVLIPLTAPFLLLPLFTNGPHTNIDFHTMGRILTTMSFVLLPVLAFVQGISLTFIKSVFMTIYLRLTRSQVLQPALQQPAS